MEKKEAKKHFCRECIHCRKYPKKCTGMEKPESCIFYDEREEGEYGSSSDGKEQK